MVDAMTESAMRAHMRERIQIAMNESGLKGERFAEALGVSKAATSKWASTGQISHFNLMKLAKQTRRPVAWFYPGYESSEEPDSMRSALEDLANDEGALEEALFEVLAARRRLSNIE